MVLLGFSWAPIWLWVRKLDLKDRLEYALVSINRFLHKFTSFSRILHVWSVFVLCNHRFPIHPSYQMCFTVCLRRWFNLEIICLFTMKNIATFICLTNFVNCRKSTWKTEKRPQIQFKCCTFIYVAISNNIFVHILRFGSNTQNLLQFIVYPSGNLLTEESED